MTAERFDLHTLDPGTVTFRRWDAERGRAMLVSVTVSQWQVWDRPVMIMADVRPGPAAAAESPGWFVELNAADDPTIWAPGSEPVLSRSDVPAHWDELIARLGLAP